MPLIAEPPPADEFALVIAYGVMGAVIVLFNGGGGWITSARAVQRVMSSRRFAIPRRIQF
jgi:hypothetical protein